MDSAYDGKPFCKLYEADTANGALLIERITPGTTLREEPELDKRLEIFYEAASGWHKEPAGKAGYPTYLGWVSRITKYMRGRKDYKDFTHITGTLAGKFKIPEYDIRCLTYCEMCLANC